MVRMSNISSSGRARAFTLVEVLFSILILGILMGLLFVAFRSTRRFASSVADRDAVATIKMGVSRFTDDCGFAPPLIRDQAQTQPRTVFSDGSGLMRFAVYNFSTDESANADLTLLRPTTLALPGDVNPFLDRRFSERTLAVYIAGSCDVPGKPGDADTRAKELPIDGVSGLGFYKARIDGSFEVPADVRKGGAATTARGAGSKFDSLIDLSKKYLTLYSYARDPSHLPANDPIDGDNGADAGKLRWVEVRDSRKVPVRYYRWVNGGQYSQGARTIYDVRTIDDLRVPPLVGRKGSTFPGTPVDRDIETNPELRSAVWAIVAAGPDGAFGDEPLALLAKRLGKTITDERKARIDAEKDNVVEVGK
ncbi:MAG: prepilin-type N-terminal cleavage/methylation domain-containing protein [Planctomycetota bacterium]|nr:prepilin-type N-terminal cleavage/methylation domain-containing protein [Planctomycetota bacterium]